MAVPVMAAKNSGEAGVVQERLDCPAWDRLGLQLWWAVQVERHLGSGQTPKYEIGSRCWSEEQMGSH